MKQSRGNEEQLAVSATAEVGSRTHPAVGLVNDGLLRAHYTGGVDASNGGRLNIW